jgi:transcription antitermination factor NusG
MQRGTVVRSIAQTSEEKVYALPLEMAMVEPQWYALYTSANHEKRVAAELNVRSIEHFLPLYSSVRRWKDRRVILDLPLFPGYIFVRIALRDKLRTLLVPSAVRLIGFSGQPVALPEGEMDILRSGLSQKLNSAPHPFLTVGRQVRIKSGPLAGLQGILLRRKGSFRFVLSVDLIQRSVAADVDSTDIEPL